ncbi:MAG: hypothetical protein ABIK92_19840 [Pseudomonadota bacterium]
MKILIIIISIIVVLIVIFKMMAKNHKKWLEQQSPTGLWLFENEEKRIILHFEEGPKEGPYKQLVKLKNGTELKEFGHWASSMNELKMLIMATDEKNNPRFGQDTIFNISYVGPDEIKIDGPDKNNIVYSRADDGFKFDFNENIEQKN